MAIKVIISDLYGVLAQDASNALYEQLAQEKGIDSHEFISRIRPHLDKLLKGRLNEQEFLSTIIEQENLSYSFEELMSFMEKNFHKIEKTFTLYTQIQKKFPEMKFSLLSNATQEIIPYLKKELELEKYFDTLFFSGQTGLKKPEFDAYKQVVEHYQLDPTEMLFIDDKMRNILIAEDIAMDCICFTSANQLEDELKKRDLI